VQPEDGRQSQPRPPLLPLHGQPRLRPPTPDQPPASALLREDQITAPIDRFLREELAGSTLTDNLRRVADAQYRAALAAHDSTGEIDKLRK
jgi:hypothetical protein